MNRTQHLEPLSDLELAILRQWAADHAAQGCNTMRQVHRLLGMYDERGRMLQGMADRMAAQSDALSRRAERQPQPVGA